MKRILSLVLALSLALSGNCVTARADEGEANNLPTKEKSEYVYENFEILETNEVVPCWNYTAAVSLYMTFTNDHANIMLDVDGYSSATKVEAVLLFEELVDGTYVEKDRTAAYNGARYLVKTWHPFATYGKTYRVTAVVKVFSGTKYETITINNVKIFNASTTVSIDEGDVTE